MNDLNFALTIEGGHLVLSLIHIFKTGIRQNHNVNLSGGGAHNTYNVSLDYYNQKGTLEGAGPNYER